MLNFKPTPDYFICRFHLFKIYLIRSNVRNHIPQNLWYPLFFVVKISQKNCNILFQQLFFLQIFPYAIIGNENLHIAK